MFGFNSSNLAVSLPGWLSRLKCWLQPDHGFEMRRDPSFVKKTPHDLIHNLTLLSPPIPLSLDLPSPTISLSFTSYSDSELEIESEPSSTESSRCHTPLGDYPCIDDSLNLFHQASESLSKADPAEISTILTTALDNSRDALLAEYSHQELVLLEFITHTPDAANVDDVLLKFPPGFSHVCQCASTVEEENDLCEVCQLLDAYMDYSFKRFRGMDVVV